MKYNFFSIFIFQDEIENKRAVVFDYADLISDPGNYTLLLSRQLTNWYGLVSIAKVQPGSVD